ncbi:hypothetical protein [Actinomadura montaniterrae]|uniref:Uncharacterized protein n=1 Tax=Actinomadura montaniterrae TaxID=1803903 RepID=A0A6L3W6U4_9ACTN|nr:hypothetical protein [Actinomadura montaniterrae]KAB2388688.1 hypothetical protein F9B16_03180 [Actinomadura montaniterrae]
MPDPDDAVAAVLDAYQDQLLPASTPSHRANSSLAESLVQSLLEHLARYAAHQNLNVHDTLEELHQRSLDHSGAEADPVHNFRLGAQVQIRQQETPTGAEPRYPRWRGFITSLTETPGGDARCIVRVPAVAKAVHVTASELEPADALLPIATRTAGVVHHARDAEQAITALTAWLKRNADTLPVTYPEKLDDLGRLAEALAGWSGGTTQGIIHPLFARNPGTAQQAKAPAEDGPRPAPVARLAAMGFPQGPETIPPDEPPAVARRPERSQRRPRRP